ALKRRSGIAQLLAAAFHFFGADETFLRGAGGLERGVRFLLGDQLALDQHLVKRERPSAGETALVLLVGAVAQTRGRDAFAFVHLHDKLGEFALLLKELEQQRLFRAGLDHRSSQCPLWSARLFG